MHREQTTLQLIERIYRAAAEPEHWNEFARALSAAYDGAVVVIGFVPPGSSVATHYYGGGPSDFGGSLVENFSSGLSNYWRSTSHYCKGFSRVGDAFPELALEDSPFYTEWMTPHGLPPVWPIVFTPNIGNLPLMGGIAIYRRSEPKAFDQADLDFGNLLIPHIVRAFEIYMQLYQIHRERRALDEVLDRLQIGVILTDASARPVLVNRCARQITDAAEVLRVANRSVEAVDAEDEVTLQLALEDAIEKGAWSAIRLGHRSGESASERSLQIAVNPVTAAPAGSRARDAAAAILIAGPNAFSASSQRFLQSLFGLTGAEADLVALLSRGASLDEAACRRGVTLNTARSQLKQAFAKTGTRRQGELIQFVLTGMTSLHEE